MGGLEGSYLSQEYLSKRNIIVQLGGKGYLLEIAQKIKIWAYYEMIDAQTRIHPRK